MTFQAPIDLDNPEAEIKYDYNSIGENDIELIQNDPQMYCMKQCFKMAYYVSKLWNEEILRMKCEFLKDENQTIWFSYANNILSRPIKARHEQFKRTKKISYINKDHQNALLQQLEAHRVKAKEIGSQNINGMYQMMSRHYGKIKTHMGLDEALA